METILKEKVGKDKYRQGIGIRMEWEEECKGYSVGREDNSYAV